MNLKLHTGVRGAHRQHDNELHNDPFVNYITVDGEKKDVQDQ